MTDPLADLADLILEVDAVDEIVVSKYPESDNDLAVVIVAALASKLRAGKEADMWKVIAYEYAQRIAALEDENARLREIAKRHDQSTGAGKS